MIATLLVEIALKGTVLLGIAMIAALLLRRSTAATRYVVWSASLVGLLTVPVLALTLPVWRVPLLAPPSAQIRNGGAAERATAGGMTAAERPTELSGMVWPSVTASLPTIPSGTRAFPADQPSIPSAAAPRSLFEWLALVWFGGIAAGLLALIGSMVALARLARRARPISGDGWTRLLAEVRRDLGISRPVVLLQSDSAAMPATWGIAKPVILLPAGADEWNEDRRRVVLLHELAHVRRNDCLMQLLAQVCCTAYWFHPAVWYTARRMRAERELACDEQVLSAGVDACDYAAHLLDIARVFRTPLATSMAAIAMARPSQLEGRLLAILDGDLDRRRIVGRATRVAILSLLAIVVLPLAAMRPWREAATAVDGKRSNQANAELSSGAVPSEASIVFGPSAARDTFRWKGAVPPGQWIEIHSTVGDIRAERATGDEVEIFAILQSASSDMPAKVMRDTRRNAVRFCVVQATSTASCTDDMSGNVRNRVASIRTDILVKVPRGVGLAAHTVTGNIAAESMESYVWGTSRRGDISISTTDLAEASTTKGSIAASFGKAAWRQNLEFLTDSGDVTVRAPSNSRMMFEVSTERGRIASDFPGNLSAFGAGQRTISKSGDGGGMLTIHTLRGQAELRRGPAGDARSPLASYGDAPSSYVDPKPNPDPDPSYDPNPDNSGADTDPNPNPSPNPNPNPPYDPDPNPPDFQLGVQLDRDAGNAGADRNNSIGRGDDPTGERVSVRIPDDIISRLSGSAQRGAPDGRAITRLRDIAASHVKKHAADLVKERALWALTLVRDGRIIDPLSAALTNSDWKVRSYAAWALGETRDSRSLQPLLSALGDSHWRVRMHAASALAEDVSPRMVPVLIGLLGDEHWQVRIAAVDALGASNDGRAVEPLRRLLRDRHEIVRGGAEAAIERLSR